MNLQDVWVLEYSPLQGCFHVDELSCSLSANRKQIAGTDDFTGYLMIFVGTYDQCNSYCDSLRKSGIKLVGRK
jgi:hypothetical protein